jgi:hypothetical protein
MWKDSSLNYVLRTNDAYTTANIKTLWLISLVRTDVEDS